MAVPYPTFTQGATEKWLVSIYFVWQSPTNIYYERSTKMYAWKTAAESWPRDLFDIYFLHSVSIYFVWQGPTEHLLWAR